MKKLFHERYSRIIITIYSLIILFRAFETFSITHNYGFDYKTSASEFFGLLMDVLGAGIFIIAYVLISFLFSNFKFKIIRIVNISLLLFTTLIFLLIIKYFLYQLIPLDISLYQYSIQEIFFTVSTSSTNVYLTIISLILFLLFVLIVAWGVHKVRFSQLSIKILYSFLLVSLPLFLVINSLWVDKSDKFSLNKPVYFIGKSIKYLLSSDEILSTKTNELKKLYPEKDFISKNYPLVYKVKRENGLGKYFNDFDGNPNIVILIVEGLNDDFIHEYKGSILMPFLSQLKDKSLYWERCLTLGERSFAAVPSILGGLPYGDRGFTLQERLPRHLSLVSILNSNDYYTSFYDGQGSWFHKKDRFFKYNDIDLIFDNSKFSDSYSKIIVGDDNFFWGFNDKDLFSQSLRVIDTLNQNPRLDIYFTGTSHSPYVINDEEYYNSRLKDLTTESYKEFYQTYSKYLKSVLFVDDALKGFFNEYKKRPEYKNTVFIITGDHPMTELPRENSLKRYHVPLIIFSDKLKERHLFTQTVSHLDISESLLSFLKNYLTHIPAISTSLGEKLISKEKESSQNIAFMNDNREVVDFLSGDYYLADDKLYLVDSLLNIKEIENDSIKLILREKLNIFNNTSLYTVRENKIITNEDYCKALQINQIYTNQTTDSIRITTEYYNLTDNIKLTNSDLIFDINFKTALTKKENISIVYQITNSKDSTLLWKNFGVAEDKIVQAHIPINKLKVKEDILYFKSYIWNQANNNFTITDLNILLYSSKPTSHNTQ